jgi:transcriptional regulator with XRE-family HTH domain
MDQQKIGNFLKTLRNEHGLTQEQLAAQLNVSRRTVSRWETGRNLPDLSILIELADFYGVHLRELLDGERKGEHMNKELEDAVLKVADYSHENEQKLTRRMHMLFVAGLVTFLVHLAMSFLGVADTSPVLEMISGFSLGVSFGMMIVGVIMTSRHALKIRAFKAKMLRHKKVQD